RRSLMRVREHGLIPEFEVDEHLQRVEILLASVWKKRGYLPGLKSLLRAVPGILENYSDEVREVCESVDTSDGAVVEQLLAAVGGAANDISARFDTLLVEIR